METTISVVIPTYRRPRLLVNCLEALSRQTLSEPFEVIVVSDGPDPLTEETVKQWLAERLEINVTFLAAPQKKGPAAARNIGWRAAKSPLIAFTDDDCVPAPNWLEVLCRAHQGQPHGAVAGRIRVPTSAHPTDFEWNTAQLEVAEFVTANCCCTKKALLATGGFDERFQMAWREDSDLHFKLIKLGIPIGRVAQAEVLHPVRQVPWGISLREQKKAQYNALLYKKYPTLYRQRIRSRPLWQYYFMALLSIVLPIAYLFFPPVWFQIMLVVWLACVANFTWKRLRPTSKSVKHVVEMAVTSALIPLLSIYWQSYGAIKYRVVFF